MNAITIPPQVDARHDPERRSRAFGVQCVFAVSAALWALVWWLA